MMPNINPRQMEQMMRKMGISQTDIDASQVIIVCPDKRIVIENPSVQKVNMSGKINYQISGNEHIETNKSSTPEMSEDDIQTVMDQTSSTQEEAIQALVDTKGNLAEAILLLTAEKEE
jgi:nascent polypeptide-associated complex subunit alpha